jgi:hypothetical protein
MAAPLAFAAGAPPRSWARPRRWFAGAWRRLSWRQVVLAALLSILAAALGPNGGAFLFFGQRSSDPFADLLIGRWVWAILPLVFAAMVADEAYWDGTAPLVAYGSALLIGSLAAFLLDALGANVVGWRHTGWGFNTFRLKALLVQGGLAIAVYAYWRTTQRALGRVRASEADRIRARQQLLAARLMALQARVEPQFLFDALTRIGAMHERDPQAADALLADLIALLRAMLPIGTATTSTVAREFTLAGAWLRVQRHVGAPIDVAIETSPIAAHSRLGAMLVLPLLQDMLALPSARRVAWRLSAEPVASGDAIPRTPRLSIRLAPKDPGRTIAGDATASTPTLERLRERLAELYGDTATLAVQMLHDGLAAFVLELPLVQETSTDDLRADR